MPLREQPLIYVPVPALAEFRFGVLQSTQYTAMQTWMAKALATTEILSVNDESTHFYAAIRLELKMSGTPIPMNDLWIAAIARQHRFPILSRNTHFDVIKKQQRISW